AGKYAYYEVLYKDQKLVLPKEITGGYKEISQFITASAIGAHETNNDCVLIVFEQLIKKENGFMEHGPYITLLVQANIHTNELTLHNTCNGQTAVLKQDL
ncbi:MAG TPA: hypothetical protein VFR70_05715, partial [Flavobacterium sp.]|nr:hypothetical protein [Flavobacterium sp.]